MMNSKEKGGRGGGGGGARRIAEPLRNTLKILPAKSEKKNQIKIRIIFHISA